MSAADVQTEILGPMQRLFLPPRQMTPETQGDALRDYLDALQGYSGEILAKAWKHVRDNHPNRGWPLPSSFIAACNKALVDRNAEAKARAGAREQKETNERWHAWESARCGSIAREAAKAGVSWSFKCRILSGDKPDAISISELRRQKERAHLTAAKIEKFETLHFNGRDIGVMEGANRQTALDGFQAIALREAETQQEISRYSRDAA